MKFREKFFKRLGTLLIKLVGSRKSFFQLLTTLICIPIIYDVKDLMYKAIFLGIWIMSNFIYMRFLQFEKIDIDAKIGK